MIRTRGGLSSLPPRKLPERAVHSPIDRHGILPDYPSGWVRLIRREPGLFFAGAPANGGASTSPAITHLAGVDHSAGVDGHEITAERGARFSIRQPLPDRPAAPHSSFKLKGHREGSAAPPQWLRALQNVWIERIEGFATEGEASRWIRNDSIVWLANRRQ